MTTLPPAPPPASPAPPDALPAESLRGPLRRVLGGAAWGLLGLAGVDLFFRLGMNAALADWLFTSDFLYLPALYRDLVEEGGRWSGWKLTPAPYFFPDMALYFALDAVTGPFVHAVLAYGAAQLVLWVLVLQVLIRTAAPRGAAAAGQVVGTAVVCALLLAFAAGRFGLLQTALISATHFSVVPMALLGLALALRAFRDGDRLALLGLAALCLLMAGSDALFVPSFVVPAGLGLVVLAWLQRPRPWRRLASVLAVLGGASLVGFWAARLLLGGRAEAGTTRLRTRQLLGSLKRLSLALGELFLEAPQVSLAWLGLLLALVAVVVACRRWAAPASARWGLYAVCLYALLALGSTTGAVLLTGLFYDRGGLRYLLLPVLLPFMVLPLSVGLLARAAWQRALAAGALGAVALGWGMLIAAHPWQTAGPSLAAYTPPLVGCLDAQQARLGQGRGVSDYWNAKRVSLFSRTGLQVVQLSSELRPEHWISNIDWYLQRSGPHPAYTFVVTERLDTALLRTRFGEPRETFRCGSVEVYVYGEGFDEALRSSLAAQPELKAQGKGAARP